MLYQPHQRIISKALGHSDISVNGVSKSSFLFEIRINPIIMPLVRIIIGLMRVVIVTALFNGKGVGGY
jgi:hypothetical protein